MIRPFLIFSAVIATTVSVFYILKKWKSKRPPKRWVKVGNVSKLYIYPLKSGRYIEREKVECTRFGLSLVNEDDKFQLRDRSFIVYGEIDLVGKSARIYPSMVLITISNTDKTHVSLSAPEMESIIFEVPSKNKSNVKTIRFQNWSDENVLTIDCGNEVAMWLSKYLLQKDSGLRLGYHDASSYRSLSSFKDKKQLQFYQYVTDACFGLYADLAAALLLNEKSLIDLNEKLDNKISRNHFRPNIVVDGPDLAPYDEDNWFWLKIGGVTVRNVKDCTRCVLSTVNPETGVRDLSREPLKTLSKYRISKGPGKGPIMGVNLEIVVPGVISVGDDILAGIDD
ncbi:mitochondrial amidoxime reducing component 2-like [Coccinella septempunctata]|uniref:mitochondrial amidoxime reducing component 2-like n=1 Tax=Coccinella septempunctata TaxID=41139 RepID=UPI001D07D81B|nr:mitochondrial amidoxime reducing component 2-like [Coccinella septempunctata]